MSSKSKCDIWNRYAQSYDLVIGLSSMYGELMDRSVEHLKSCTRILDVGCGTGNLLMRLQEKGKTLYGIDSNENMLDYARKKLDPEVSLSLQDAIYLRLPDNLFDGAVCINVLYYVDEPRSVLLEINRLLKKRGRLVIAGPKPNIDYESLENSFNKDLAEVEITPKLMRLINVFKECNEELIKNAMKNVFETKELEEILVKEIGFSEIVYSTDEHYLGQSYFIVAEK